MAAERRSDCESLHTAASYKALVKKRWSELRVFVLVQETDRNSVGIGAAVVLGLSGCTGID